VCLCGGEKYVSCCGVCDGESELFEHVQVTYLCRLLTERYQDGYLWVTEWPLYVGDFALMAITLIVCLAWYDRNISSGNKLREDVRV
jgi:hypothetical protein